MKNRQSIRLFNDMVLYSVICAVLTFICYTLIVLKMKQPLSLWLMVMTIMIALANIGSILDLVQFILWPESDWVKEQKEHGVDVSALWKNFYWIGFATLSGGLVGMLASFMIEHSGL